MENFDPIFDIKRNSYLTSFYSGNVDGDRLNNLLAYIEANHIQVFPEKIFKLHEVQLAHEYLQSQSSFGKVIVMNNK